MNRLLVVSTVPDTRAAVRLKHIQSLGFHHITHLNLVDVYTIDKKLSVRELALAGSVLINPVTQKIFVQTYMPAHPFSWAVEVGYLPGVTDNIATTAKESIADRLGSTFGSREGVYTSQILFFAGSISKKEIEGVASSLINPLIERVSVKDYSRYKKDGGMDAVVPKVRLTTTPRVDTVNLQITDDALVDLGKYGIKNTDGTRRGPLALDLPSLKAIQAYFKKRKRHPTDVELESIAQTWSEHCKHAIFSRPIDDIQDGLYAHYIKRATKEIRASLGDKDFCVSVFRDNSGAIAFDAEWAITHKVETHNSPSALDPFGGAVTGIVGVNRDAIGFGLGAKPIANIYGFCVADPADTTVLYRDRARTQPLLPPRRILEGVIAGVNSGGNCSGIPTPQGFLYFDPRYKGKPLVFAGTVGLIPRRRAGKKLTQKKAKPGDYIVMMGGRVGIDGIHGATFSSEALTSGSPATAVQIGDPITQKKVSDVLIKEARDAGLYSSITDNGAGGLSCSVAEMAKEAGGCRVTLEKVPLKYSGLVPWQIWISESQERMTLAVPRGKWKKLKALCDSRGVEVTVIGVFTRAKTCSVTYHGKTVMNVSMDFLHDGLPMLPQRTESISTVSKEPTHTARINWNTALIAMLGRLNITSTEWVSMQYDHEVQGTSVVKPLQGDGRVNGDASVIRPILAGNAGIVLTQALYPRYGDIDAYRMAASAIDTAVRNAIAMGADPGRIAILDNFCWCSAHDPKRLGQLKHAAQACYDYAAAYKTPFISGKDSMFNDFSGYDAHGAQITISIPPTLLISAIGVIADIAKAVSLDVKVPGDLVYVLGETHDELGASEYYAWLAETSHTDALGKNVPRVDAALNKRLYGALARGIKSELIASAQSVHRGGLVTACVKSALGGMLGMEISLKDLPGSATSTAALLFSESQGRVLVTINPKHKKTFEKKVRNLPYKQIGIVTDDRAIVVKDSKDKKIVSLPVEDVYHAYKARFAGY